MSLAFALSSLAQGPSPPVDPSAPPVEQLCAAPPRSRAPAAPPPPPSKRYQHHHLRNSAPRPPASPPHATSHHRRPPLPAAQIVPSLSFSNPFQQYAGGVIPGWEYGGEATLASDYITLTPATPNKVGWVWAAEPAALGSWEVQLEMHIGGAAQRGAGGGMAFW